MATHRPALPRKLLLGTFAGAFVAPAFLRTPASAAQFQFKCGGIFPTDHPMSIRDKQMWEAVNRESGGRIDAQYFPGLQLGSDVSQFALLRSGAIQFYHCSSSTAGSIAPVSNISDVAFAFSDTTEAAHAFDGPLGEYVRKEYDAKGVHALSRVWDSGLRQLINSKRPIRSASDLEGLRIRTAESKITVDFFKELGASPTPLPFAELYTTLQTHLVDGAEQPLTTIQSSRFYEVQKYLSLTNDSWSCFWWMANSETWKLLPPDLQGIIDRNNAKYALLGRADGRALSVALVDKIAREGVTINTGDSAAFRARLSNYYVSWKANFGPTVWGLLQSSIKGKLG